MPLSLIQNLTYAEMAVKYAERYLRGKSANKPEDIAHTMQEKLRKEWKDDPEAVKDMLRNRHEIEQRCDAIWQQRVDDINTIRKERRQRGERLNAAAIIRDGIGNCFEQSVLACHFLDGKMVDSYLVVTDEDTNHVFVIIGAPPGLDGRTIEVRLDSTPNELINNGLGVVCDPWYHEWFGIQQSWVKMYQILRTTNKRRNRYQQPLPLPEIIPLCFQHAARLG